MKLELSKSILESISSRVNNDIFTFDDVESEYKLDNIQEKLYNRLYKNYQDLTPPQFDLDTFRFTYKILCQNSGVKKTPQKQLNKVKDRKIVYDATTDESFESRIVGSSVRDEEGKVIHYEFRILIRDKESLKVLSHYLKCRIFMLDILIEDIIYQLGNCLRNSHNMI